jgi:hypothetical protein
VTHHLEFYTRPPTTERERHATAAVRVYADTPTSHPTTGGGVWAEYAWRLEAIAARLLARVEELEGMAGPHAITRPLEVAEIDREPRP